MVILCLDLETSGIDPVKNTILQIAAELHVDNKLKDKFNEKIKQQQGEIDLGALKVNGVKLNQFSSYGNPESVVIANFVDWLLTINKTYGKPVVLGHNVNFDLGFLKATLQRYGIVGLDNLLDYRVLDTATLGLALKEAGLLNIDKVNSINLFKALNLKINESLLHTADYDVKLTAQAYIKMIELLRSTKNEQTSTTA